MIVNNMEGFFQIHRQIFDSWIFADDKALKIFIWLIGKARHKDGVVPMRIGKGVQTIKLKKGQLIFGRHTAEEELFYNGSLIYRKLQKLESDGTINIESNNQYSIITICKYEEYQFSESKTNKQRTSNEQATNSKRTSNEQATNSKQTSNEQATNTNNTDNNDNNYNNTLTNLESLIFSEFKKITGKKIRVFDTKAKSNLKARLKDGYTKEDIILAISNCKKDPYHIEHPQFLTLEFILRADKLSKYSTCSSVSVETKYNPII